MKRQLLQSTDIRRIDLPGRILVAHQAEFMPWLGFISKATMGDIYILLDDTQFKKEYFENRNKIRIKSETGWHWIQVPVGKKKIQNINKIDIIEQQWKKKLLNSIKYAYSRTPYFDEFFCEFSKLILEFDGVKLIDLNYIIIKYAFEKFDVSVPIFRTSEINKSEKIITGESTDLVINMCKEYDAKVFVAGISGRDYLDRAKFDELGIKLVFQMFEHPLYSQYHGKFMPFMTFLDLLFNHGSKESINLLGKSKYVL